MSAEKMPGIVPLAARRPSNPYRLGKIIIDAFTDMVYGENRFPEIVVEGDDDAQDFMRTVSNVMTLPTKMIQARNLGGACGTVGLSWAIVNGIPRCRVHNAKNLRVVEWEDRDALIPRHVEEVQLFYRDEPDPARGNKIVRNWYWWRRSWTPDEDLVYEEVPAKANQMPVWSVDTKRSSQHGDGLCHFVWVQNHPSEEEDGVPDIEGLWEQLDEIDIIYSIITRGAKLNLDPTLLLKMDQDRVRMMGVKKGSDNALVLGKEGEASYLELAGTSITSGLAIFESMRRTILESAQCVVPDPNVIAAQGVSSVSIKALYSPMLGRAAVLREQYAQAKKRILEGVTAVSREKMRTQVTVVDTVTGTKNPGKFVLNLPPKIIEEEILDEEGMPTGEKNVKLEPRDPGEAGEVTFSWPNWFSPTPEDQNKVATTLTAANGGKAFLSKQTTVEIAAQTFGRDASEEWQRVQDEGKAEREQQAAMFEAAAGGAPGEPGAPPGGAPGNGPPGDGPPKPGAPPGGEEPKE